MTQNPARDPFSPDPWTQFLDAEETYRWLLAEARWFAEQARDAESAIQTADGYWPHDWFPWERP